MYPQLPLSADIVNDALIKHELSDAGLATIREVSAIVADIEEATGIEFIRMEIGIPGLAPPLTGVQAEIEALRQGVASRYPNLEGLKSLKKEGSRFVKAFMNVDIDAQGCIATSGSMQGSYASFLLSCQLDEKKNTILFLDPGFPVQKQQVVVMGYQIASFDIYEHRGVDFEQQLEEYLMKGNIAAIVYSNPNNPTWICLHEDELEVIGRLSTKYEAIVIEDLAYFAMDFRTDMSKPFEAPYQPSVANYCDNYILLISSSKVFSYAGQRVALMCISNNLYNKHFHNLLARYGIEGFGNIMIQRVLYTLSAGASHSAQYALAAMLKAASDGQFEFLEDVHEYELRAREMKQMFVHNGFNITYPNDIDTPIANGFYFTISYGQMTAGELLQELLRYGISAIALYSTGSSREGLRICVSQTKREKLLVLQQRLTLFKQQNSLTINK